MTEERAKEKQGQTSSEHDRHIGRGPGLVESVEAMIRCDFSWLYKYRPELVRIAINEAAALAWRTEYPALVLHALALEKVHAIAAWLRRQEALRLHKPFFEAA